MNLQQQLRARWTALAPRERGMVAVAAALVAVALAWWIAFAPAIATLRSAQAQHRLLDARLQQMQRLQAEAKGMQGQPRRSREDAARLLEAAVRQHLGTSARYSIAGDRVTVTLVNTPAAALAQWLAAVRTDAHAIPAEARLTRGPAGDWNGTVSLGLPAR